MATQLSHHNLARQRRGSRPNTARRLTLDELERRTLLSDTRVLPLKLESPIVSERELSTGIGANLSASRQHAFILPASLTDLNGDGRINLRDYRIGVSRLIAQLRVHPVSIGLDASSDPNHDGVVSGPHVVLVGLASRFTRVRLDQNADGRYEQTTYADALGHYTFATDVGVGHTSLIVQSTDRFRHRFKTHSEITRSDEIIVSNPDRVPPVISVQDLPPGFTTSRNVTVTGRVTDASSGVLSLRARTDTGAFVNVSLGANGSFTFTTSLPLDGTADGPHQLLLSAIDRAGNVSTKLLSFSLSTQSFTNLSLGLDSAFDTAPVGDNQTRFAAVTLSGQTAPKTVVTLVGLNRSVTAGTDGRFTFTNVALKEGANSFTASATNTVGNLLKTDLTVTRLALPPGTVTLAEAGKFASQTTIPVDLGQTDGTRTLSFTVDAGVDTTDKTAAVEDTLLVYLVDPTDQTKTLLDRGTPGTAVFALAGGKAEYTPGLVRFDGSNVEIDVTSLGTLSKGLLVVQAINHDADDGSVYHVFPVTDQVDTEGTPSPVFSPLRRMEATAGTSIDLAGLSSTTDVRLQVGNVRFDATSGKYAADLTLKNNGPAVGRKVVAVFPGLPQGVTLLDPSGTNTGGAPYISFQKAIPAGGLQTGAESEPITVTFSDPNGLRFALHPSVMAGVSNRAPVFSAISTLTVAPGNCLTVPMPASDPDGDTVKLSIRSTGELPTGTVGGDGTLVFNPTPGQIGTYHFTLVASDGAAESTRDVTLNVAADPVTTTRISGVIEDTNKQPLVNLPIQVGTVQTMTDASGHFMLDFGTAAVPGDALRVLGRNIPGNFPFIAEKLPLLLGHPVFDNVDNVICRTIYLPSLNAGTPIDPSVDETVTKVLKTGEAASQVFVSAGSLKDQQGNDFTGNLSITEVPVNLTPAALPTNLMPDLVVTIQPGDMVFTQRAPLTLPNRSGWAPGTVMDLWSINPVTGVFDKVGVGTVSSDGSVIQTTSGGIRNSSWHFFAPPPPKPDDNTKDDHNKNNLCPAGVATATAASDVELHTGALLEHHDLVTYQSLGVSRGLSLNYNSLRADPRPIIHFGYSQVTANPNQRLVARMQIERGSVMVQVPGFAGGQFGLPGGEHFWSIDSSGSIRVALQADLSSLPSGVYTYDLTTGILQFNNDSFSGSTSNESGQIVNVNSIGSVFGNGWGIAGLLQIVENPDGSVLLIDGNGGQQVFGAPATAGQPLVSPPGDFTKFVKLGDGTYQRTFTDGTVQKFNTDGFLATVTDRNGNQTKYEYSGPGMLTKVIDPVGLETRLLYSGGHVTQIIDPANRVTKLDYDDAGNLTRVTDPDGTSRTWEYDTLRHMTGETDQRGSHEQEFYNFAGRVTKVIRKDGTELQFDPVQSQVLYPADMTIDPNHAPSVSGKDSAMAKYTDSNGKVTEVMLDQAGQAVSSRDSVGGLPSSGRNDQNEVTRTSDARGNPTFYDYDAQGNVVRIRDTVSSSSSARRDNLGTEFWLGFPENYQGTNQPALFITSEVATQGVVTIPSLNFSQTFSTTPGQVVTITLPTNAQVTSSDAVENLGIHVTADAPVAVYGFSREQYTTDGYLGLPVSALGASYLAFTYQTNTYGTQFLVVATQDQTQVTITPRVAIGSHAAGVPYTVMMDKGQTYQLFTTAADLSGTQIVATAPVALFSGNRCGNVPPNANFCDYLVEQIPPTNTWGTSFVTEPLATRLLGDTFRYLASTDNTEIQVNGQIVATLNRGEVYEQILTQASVITASQPILVAQFSNGSSFDGVTSDPFMTLVPPSEQFVNRYTVTTPATGFRVNYINVVASAAVKDTILLDGAAIDATLFHPIADSDFFGAQIPVSLGTYHLTGQGAFGVLVYGFDQDDSYGYLGGQAFSSLTFTDKSRTYDPKFSQLTSSTDELGHQTIYTIDPANGNTLGMRRVVGLPDNAQNGETDDALTTYTYTTRGLVDTVTDPLGRVTDYDYDALGRMMRITHAKGTLDEAEVRYEYDQAGNKIASIDENGNRTKYQYGIMNRLVQTIDADPDGPSGPLVSSITLTSYDEAGNVLTTTDARGNMKTNVYDSLNRLIQTIAPDPDGVGPLPAPVTRYTYDAAGNVASVIDPIGHAILYVYDGRNRLSTTTDPNGGVTKYGYDAVDNLTLVTDPGGNKTISAYDSRNRVIAMTDPLGKKATFAYDSANNLIDKIDRDGRETRHEYDEMNRPRNEIWVGLNDTVLNTITYAYDDASNLLSVADGQSQLAYTYDARNRVNTVDNQGTPGAPRVMLTYAYDDVGNVVSVDDTVNGAHGATTVYRYDELNRLDRLTQTGSGLSDKRVDFAYNPLGQYASINRFRDLAGTQLVIGTGYDYDGENRLTRIDHKNALKTSVAVYDYAYDVASRIARITDVDGTNAYAYDDRDQLTSVDHSASNNPDEQYRYDGNGNRLESHLHGSAYRTEPSTDNRLRTDGTSNYVYDDEGNLVKRTEIATGNVREFTWDYRNRLMAVTEKTAAGVATQELRYTYDAMNRRISASVDTSPNDSVPGSTTHFEYDREDVLLDFIDSDGSGPDAPVLAVRYLHGTAVDQVLAQEVSGGVVNWLLADHLGTTRDVVESSGLKRNHIVYDSFGNVLSQTDSTTSTRYQFTGREYDSGLRMYYYRDRYYDPTSGRFISQDPIRPHGDRNFYRYAKNIPNSRTDPFGQQSCSCGEPLNQAGGVGPWDAWRARQLAQEALAVAQNSGLPGAHNGPQDAFRHCYWSCRMTQELGESQAQQVGDIHEECGAGPAGETSMDLSNNAAGRRLANTPMISAPSNQNHCEKACRFALQQGELQDAVGGNSTPGYGTY